MKTTIKRRLALAGAVAMALTSLTACGSKQSSAVASVDAASASFPLTDTVTFTALTHEPSFAGQEINDRLIAQRLEEETNVHIDWTVYVDDQFGEKKQLALAKKELPDMVFDAQMSQYDLLRYAKDGTIIAVDDLIDQYMPNLKKILDENPEYRTLITAPDGHIYSFPWIEELGSGKESIQAIGGIPWINKSWLDELGLAMPTTPDELTEVLRAFKQAHPDSLPLSFVMNGGNEDVGVLLSSFGYGDTTQDNIFEMKDDGTLQHLPIPAGVVPYELRMKTNLGGPLAVLDSYYGQYTTMPDDATLRLDTIQQLYSPCMQSDYDYPPIFFDIDTTDRITQIETDLKPYAESQKATWIMNGGAEEGWDDYIAKLNEMNLQELLQLKQTGLDNYFASTNAQ